MLLFSQPTLRHFQNPPLARNKLPDSCFPSEVRRGPTSPEEDVIGGLISRPPELLPPVWGCFRMREPGRCQGNPNLTLSLDATMLQNCPLR